MISLSATHLDKLQLKVYLAKGQIAKGQLTVQILLGKRTNMFCH